MTAGRARHPRRALLAGAIWLAPAVASGQPAARLQPVLDSILAANPDVPGLAVHIESRRRSLSWSGVAGLADRDRKVRLSPAHAFRIASNTKTYIAAAALRLWEGGKLGLDDPIARHLSAESGRVLVAGGYDLDRITIRHLLSHTSGLYDYAMDSAYSNRVVTQPSHRWTRLEQLQFAVDHGAPYGEPGERYHYADTGYILLGEIIERGSGLPLARALRVLLSYGRLGLRSTWLETLEPRPAAVRGRAHQFQGDLDTYRFDPSLDLYGGGGLAATTRDMAVFTRALFAGGVYGRPETADTMLTRVDAAGMTGYRFGIGETALNGYRAYGHSGYWGTFSYYLPDLDLAIAGSVLQNQRRDLPGAMIARLLDRLQPARAALLVDLQAALGRVIADSTLAGVALHVESAKLALTWSGAAGLSDRDSRRPLRPDQPMRMASTTKTYVATAILRLWEEGRLGLDDPIAHHLPGDLVATLRLGGYAPDRITIRHLLHHTGGLFDYAMDSAYTAAVTGDPGHRWTRMEQLAFAMEKGAPYGAPGAGFHYSDTGYILLGEILERKTGLTLGAALRDLVGYERLGLWRTWLESIDPDPWYAGDRAHQYFGALDTYEFDPSVDLYGGGGLAASVKDMALFTRGLLTGRIFARAATLDTMLLRPTAATQRDYRMGIYSMSVDGDSGFGHTGFWGTFSFYFPSLDLGVAGSITQQSAGRSLPELLTAAVRAVATAARRR